jgi:ribosomal protein S18 acetylase RimI-like enzyme
VDGDEAAELFGLGTSPGTLELRRLTTDDWEIWRDVRLRALAEAPYAFGSTLSYWQGDGDLEERWRGRLADVPLNVVALIDHTPIGQVSGTSPDHLGRCELISMWVDPAARGHGVGEALIHQVVEWATSLEVSAVVLSVKERNAHAIALYERAGFTGADEPADDPSEIRMRHLLR